MKPLFLPFLTTVLLSSLSCAHDMMNDTVDEGISETVEYLDINVEIDQFDGLSPIVFEQNDALSLLFSKDDFSYVPYTDRSINELKVGAVRDLILVNPARNGRVLAFDGNKEIVNNLGMKNMIGGEENTETNLSIIADKVRKLSRSVDYIFTLTRENDGFHIRHKDSGKGFTDKGEDEGRSRLLYWSDNASALEFSDASAVTNKLNLATGAPCQLFIKEGELVLFSGETNGVLRWYKHNPERPSTNTNWLIYQIPVMNYQYSVKSVQGEEAIFRGIRYADNTEYYAVYPYCKTAALEDGELKFSIDRVKQYAVESIEHGTNTSVAKIDPSSSKVRLENVFGILTIPVKGGQKISSIEITDKSGDNLWGEASVDVTNLEFTSIKGGSSTCVLDCQGVTTDNFQVTDFSVLIPAGSLSKGFRISIITDEGEASFEYDGVAIQRGKVLKLDTISLTCQDFSVPVYSIENDIVADYLSRVNYEMYSDVVFSSGCKSAFKSDYYDIVKSIWDQKLYRTDCPNKVRVNWQTTDSENVRVVLSLDESISCPVRDTLVIASQGYFNFTNLLPDRHYHYHIYDDNNSELLSGEFKTKGTLRMIEAEGSWNVRDMGGMVSYEYGRRRIRYEQLYRGGSLNRITEKARVELSQIGIKAELDLRGVVDPQDGQHSGESINVNDIHTIAPLYSMIYGAEYKQIMSDFVISGKYHSEPPLYCTALVKDLAWIIFQLKKDIPHPVYYHCKLGADRTNAVAYSIEALLGCTLSDMTRDYEITSFGFVTGMIDRYVTGNETFNRCFTQLIEVPDGCISLSQKMYYYFNQHFNDAHISDDDLDWFIEYMLGMSDSEFRQYKSGWIWKTKSYSTTLEDIFSAPTINQ